MPSAYTHILLSILLTWSSFQCPQALCLNYEYQAFHKFYLNVICIWRHLFRIPGLHATTLVHQTAVTTILYYNVHLFFFLVFFLVLFFLYYYFSFYTFVPFKPSITESLSYYAHIIIHTFLINYIVKSNVSFAYKLFFLYIYILPRTLN